MHNANSQIYGSLKYSLYLTSHHHFQSGLSHFDRLDLVSLPFIGWIDVSEGVSGLMQPWRLKGLRFLPVLRRHKSWAVSWPTFPKARPWPPQSLMRTSQTCCWSWKPARCQFSEALEDCRETIFLFAKYPMRFERSRNWECSANNQETTIILSKVAQSIHN